MSKIKQYMNHLADEAISHSKNVEIERKFLVTNNSWKKEVVNSSSIIQTYMSTSPAIRVRTRNHDATLTIKAACIGMTRDEFEYTIPYADAVDLIELFSDNTITKIRHLVKDLKTQQTWEIDEFRGYNSGLVIAEIELSSEDEKINTDHNWLGEEVTDEYRYYNSSLVARPFQSW